jgi:hypothetical protein
MLWSRLVGLLQLPKYHRSKMSIAIGLKLVHVYFLLDPMNPISFAVRQMAARSLFIMHARLSERMGDQGEKLVDATNFV